MKTYNLFISHSWAYRDTYDRLINLLNKNPYFHYKDYSVPKEDQIHTSGTDSELYEAIKRKINQTNVVVILAGVYATYSKWINKEIEIAQKEFLLPKPILAIQPFAAEKTSQIVKEAADEIVKWNTNSIITGIHDLADK